MSQSSSVGLSVVAPCFNEADAVPEFYRRVKKVCLDLPNDSYEIVLIDDGSRDATWSIMGDIARHDPHVVAIKLSRNFGHQLALTAGLHCCRGRQVLIIDADLQDPPELLPEMMSLMVETMADVVYGQRRLRSGETYFKTISATQFYRLLHRLTDVPIPKDTGDFRLMSRRAVDALNKMPEHYRFIRGMVTWIGLKQVPFVYDRKARYAGETKYPFSKMVRFAIDAVTGFSIIPLRAASFLGVSVGAIGLLLLTYTLGSWAFGQVVEGWTSLTSIFLIVSSAQLLVLGCFGEYLGRLYMESKRRPLFIIEETIFMGEPMSSFGAHENHNFLSPAPMIE